MVEVCGHESLFPVRWECFPCGQCSGAKETDGQFHRLSGKKTLQGGGHTTACGMADVLFQNPLKVAVVHNFYRAGQFSLNISEVHLVYAILKCNCKFA